MKQEKRSRLNSSIGESYYVNIYPAPKPATLKLLYETFMPKNILPIPTGGHVILISDSDRNILYT